MKQLYYWLIRNFGFNAKTFLAFFRNLPSFTGQYFQVKKMYKGKVSFVPYLADKSEGAGNFMHEYFIQDVFAAQLVHQLNPVKVVDVGSRIDGYIASLISFRPVELIDFRPMTASVKNLSFVQMNFSDKNAVTENYTDFVSCLHSIEHFGLGRYGDPLNMHAVSSALECFHKILKINGLFLLSSTFGQEHIQFNRQWIFDLGKMQAELINLGFQTLETFYLAKDRFISENIEKIIELSQKSEVLVILLCRKIR